MSALTELVLDLHRAIWFPVLYAMGLEGRSVELMDRRFRYTVQGLPGSGKPTRRKRPSAKKAAV
jgi:hypothetical protein